MAIVAGDFKWYLTGGVGNTDKDASLGGVRSTTQVAAEGVHDLFDQISGTEDAASDVEYRCIALRNEHATLTAEAVKLWISGQTAGGASIAIGLDPAGVSATAATVANENTAPAGVTFSTPSDDTGGLAIGNLAPNAFYAVWIRRTAANNGPLDSDSATLTFAWDTAA